MLCKVTHCAGCIFANPRPHQRVVKLTVVVIVLPVVVRRMVQGSICQLGHLGVLGMEESNAEQS